MRFYVAIALSIFAGLFLAACGGQTSDPEQDTNGVRVSLATNPESPRTGQIELVATVTDAHGRPVDDADVFMIADHTEMRGMTMTGTATAQGDGRYAITADFVHPGTWRVTIQVNQDGTNVALEDFDLTLR